MVLKKWINLSSLTYIEKQKLERELRMDGGYVLNFSNRTYEEFFREVVGVQIGEDVSQKLISQLIDAKGKIVYS
jgi:hypothetical protein